MLPSCYLVILLWYLVYSMPFDVVCRKQSISQQIFEYIALEHETQPILPILPVLLTLKSLVGPDRNPCTVVCLKSLCTAMGRAFLELETAANRSYRSRASERLYIHARPCHPPHTASAYTRMEVHALGEIKFSSADRASIACFRVLP